MNIQEMHIAVEQEMNKVNSFLNFQVEPQEMDFALNRNIIRFVKQRYGAQSNLKGKGFEMSQKRYDDLRSLVVPSFTQSTRLVDPSDIEYPNKVFAPYAADYAIMLNTTASIVDNTCTTQTFEQTTGAYVYSLIPLKAILANGSFSWSTFQFGYFDGSNYNTFISQAGRPGFQNYSPTLDYSLIAQMTRDYIMRIWDRRLASNKQPKFQVYIDSFEDLVFPGNLIIVWQNEPQNIGAPVNFVYTTVPSGPNAGKTALKITTTLLPVFNVGQLLHFIVSSVSTLGAVVLKETIGPDDYYIFDIISGALPGGQTITTAVYYKSFYSSYAAMVTGTDYNYSLISPATSTFTTYQTAVNEEAGETQPASISTITRLTQQDDITISQDNPWLTTGPDQVLITVSDLDMEAYQKVNNFIITKLTISYLRLPITVSWYLGVNCDLPEFTHDEIVTMTASYLLEEFESGRYQTHKETLISNE